MSKGENMVERAARAVYERIPNGGYVITGHGTAAHANDFRPDAWEDAPDRHEQCRDIALAVIEALIEEPASGALLARVEEVARSLNPSRSEDHIKSVALDALSIHRAILRTALSQPNDEGEGK